VALLPAVLPDGKGAHNRPLVRLAAVLHLGRGPYSQPLGLLPAAFLVGKSAHTRPLSLLPCALPLGRCAHAATVALLPADCHVNERAHCHLLALLPSVLQLGNCAGAHPVALPCPDPLGRCARVHLEDLLTAVLEVGRRICPPPMLHSLPPAVLCAPAQPVALDPASLLPAVFQQGRCDPPPVALVFAALPLA
jgi:hypothetical protein